MRRTLFVISLVAFIFLLSACSKIQTNIQPSPQPVKISPTMELTQTATSIPLYPSITPYVEPLATITPTVTSTPFVPTVTPTRPAFVTNTPLPSDDAGQYLLRIVSPGPMSKVVSPIELVVNIAGEFTGTTRIELIGEDGTELYRKIYKTYPNLGHYTRVDEKITFEIRGAAELARLQISTFDISGRMQAYSSVRLLVQAVGDNEITAANQQQDKLLLLYPIVNQLVGGGSLPVMGEYQPADELPIVLEIIDDSGKVLGSRIIQLGQSDGTYQQFTTTIPFQVTNKTPVRLVIRQSDDRIDGLAYLFSRTVILSPK
jgi:hypothetical protein